MRRDNGERAPIPRGRVRSLLALLLVQRGEIILVDRVVDELWGAAEPQHARNAAHVVASRLRRAMGEDLLVWEGDGYALRVAPEALDAMRFEALLSRGREELGSRRPQHAAETFRAALGLWRGPPLADVADEGFAQPEIRRLNDLHLAAVSERVDADLACGRHTELTGELAALVYEHPLRERLRAQLMLALYRAGRQVEALAEFRAARRALVEGLGLEPSPELRALERAILRHELDSPLAACSTRAA